MTDQTTLKLWDAATGTAVPHLRGALRAPVTSVAFSPDGTRLVSGSDDKTVKHWDVSSGQLIRTLEGHSDRVKSVAFSPDGSRVLSGGNRTATSGFGTLRPAG